MKRILRFLSVLFASVFVFSSCEPIDPFIGGFTDLNRPEKGQYIGMEFGDEAWYAIEEQLGSCYAKYDSENPNWYDAVACTEDVSDFSIEYYRKYLFLHIDLDSIGRVSNFQIIYYKNKNTERSGDYELNLVSLDGKMQVFEKDGKLSGVFEGRMKNTARSSDVRESRIVFQDFPLQSIR